MFLQDHASSSIPTSGNIISLEDRYSAVFMSLRRGPISTQAKAWVHALFDTIVLPAGKISDKPSSHEKARVAIGALMADLMDCQGGRKDGGPPLCGSRGMSRRHYPAAILGFGFDIFVQVVAALKDAGLLVTAIGQPRWTTWSNPQGQDVTSTKGLVTRFRLTEAAVESAEAHGIPVRDWGAHWGQSGANAIPAAISEPLVVLRGQKVRDGAKKPSAPDLPVDLTDPEVAKFHTDLQELNAFLGRQTISGFAFAGIRRIWNDGDVPGLKWRRGGRFASLPGGDAYEAMSAERRLKRIRINDQAVAEVDIRACHLTLLYGFLGAEMLGDQDPYAVDGLPRAIVKGWVSQAIGLGRTDFTRWSADAKGRYVSCNAGRSLSTDFKTRDVGSRVIHHHHVLEHLKAGKLDSVGLMFHEAEVLAFAMRQLRLEDIPALPIHDGLIVPVRDVAAVKAAMTQAFKSIIHNVTGIIPTVSPNLTIAMAPDHAENNDVRLGAR